MLAHVGAYSAYATPGRVNQFTCAARQSRHTRRERHVCARTIVTAGTGSATTRPRLSHGDTVILDDSERFTDTVAGITGAGSLDFQDISLAAVQRPPHYLRPSSSCNWLPLSTWINR